MEVHETSFPKTSFINKFQEIKKQTKKRNTQKITGKNIHKKRKL